jgi:hypothetical protein
MVARRRRSEPRIERRRSVPPARQAAAPVVLAATKDEAALQEGSVNASDSPSPRSTVLPIVGGAGSALAFVLAAEQLNVSKLQVAVTLAGAGAVTAASTTGWIRDIAIGVAAAGACVAAMEAVTLYRVAQAFKTAAEPPPPQAPPVDAVTQADLQAAMAKIAEQQNRAQEALHTDLKSVIAEAASAASQTLAPTVSTGAAVHDPVVVAKIQNVMARLEPSERRRLNEIASQASVEQRAYLEHEIFRRPLDESVEYLRTQVLVGSNGHAPA